MKYVLTAEKLKIKLKDDTWAERDHLDDGLWFFIGGERFSAYDVAVLSGQSSGYIKGLTEAGRSYALLTRHDRARLKAIKEYVSHNDTPLLAAIKKMLARKYMV